MKIKILKNKVANMNFAQHIKDEVYEFIANICESDIRTLEGSLTRVIAYSTMFFEEEITIDLVKEALKGTFNYNIENKNDIQKIQRIVADYYNISVEDLKSKKRGANIAGPRHIAIYLARNMTDESFPRIGMEFGGRDHSTVMNSCDKISNDIKTNEKLKEVIEELKKKIK